MATRFPRLQNNNMATEDAAVENPDQPRTSDFYRTKNIPERFDRPGNEAMIVLLLHSSCGRLDKGLQ